MMVNPQPPRPFSGQVSGQVFWSDGQPINDIGFTVRVLDAVSSTNLVPLGQPAVLQANGTYRYPYTWQPTIGRTSPNLVVQVFNSQGMMVGQAIRPSAGTSEVLNITVNVPPPPPPTFTLYCTVRDQATNATLPNLRVEALFQVNNRVILNRSATTDAKGIVRFKIERSLLAMDENITVFFQVYPDTRVLQARPTISNLKLEDQKLDLSVTIPPPVKEYVVKGTVRQSNGAALEGAIVHADNVKQGSDRLGTTTTDNYGFYEIRYTLPAEADSPDLIVSVYNNQGEQLTASPRKNNAQTAETIDLTIPPKPEPEAPFVVKGYVLQADGTPIPDIPIRAFDRDLRREQLLGEQRSDRTGFYEITYRPSQFNRAEKQRADLVSKAFAVDGSLLVTSPILFNAPAIAEIDLTVSAALIPPLTLYEKIQQAVSGLLDGLPIEQLEENTDHQDISFLAGETEFAWGDIACFALAHKLTARSGIASEFWFALLGSSFFVISQAQTLEQQLATILTTLVTLDAIAVRNSLNRSFDLQEISATLRRNIEEWITAFLQFVARYTVSDTGGEPSFVKSVLDDIGVTSPDKQIQFARLLQQYRSITPELITTLQQNHKFTIQELADIQTSFQLKDLTQGDFSIVKAIKNEFSVHQPEQIRNLAKQSEQMWIEFVTTQSAAGNITIPLQVSDTPVPVVSPQTEIYGKLLDRQFREAFPTTAFVGGLERAVQNGGANGIQQAEVLNEFLNQHENFEFLNTPVDSFLQNQLNPDQQELAADRNFRLELKAVQRVFKLAPTFETTNTLLADNLHSAQQIYRLGETEFVRQYGDRPGFTPEIARLTWNRASETYASALFMVTDLKALDNEGQPLALKHSGDLSTFPNWNNLFKAGDLCECEHCRSVLSPAAYFADLLMFLKDRDTRTGRGKVKDVLFGRRGDLGYLELNCDNALVPLPYVDVVCEILEAAIDATHENDLELTGFTTLPPIPADPVAAQAVIQAVKTAVVAAFQTAVSEARSESSINYGKQIIQLGSNISISQIDRADPDRWVIHSDTVTYLLKKKAPTPHFFATILPNTKAKAEELRSYPQYINPKVYDKLRRAKYPITLPFDLFAEEVRAGFKKTNLQRWDLMQTLRGNAAPNNPDDGAIAAEYFGISVSANSADPSEKNLILDANVTADWQKEVWGEIGNDDWLNPNPPRDTDPTRDREIKNVVGNVKKFLRKTNLEYNELLTLLDLKFINPAGNINIRHFDSSCDTDQKAVLVLDEPALDRIHRFLRLWRKLDGWKMWELDLVIRHPRIGKGAINELFLINLFYFSQLKNKLGGKTTVEQVCALFGNLNTETHFTQLHEKREDALYQKLFLNTRLIQPLNPAFFLVPTPTAPPGQDLPSGQTLTDHHSTIIAALGIREADLIFLKELTKALDGTPYVINDLNLRNLSILWRHSWLSKLLKFKVEDWKILLTLLHQSQLHFSNLDAAIDFLDNPGRIFSSPRAAFEFLEKVDHLKATGFTPDELNWLLVGDRTAKAALKEIDANRFLTALRQQLQSIRAEYSSTTLPADVAGLTTLLTSLLQKLNRNETEISTFLATLRGSVQLATQVQGLPSGFAFPASVVGAPNHIPIQYDEASQQLRFIGLISNAQQQILLNDTEATLVNLRSSVVSEADVQNLPTGFTFPAAIVGAPNNISIQYDESNQQLRLTGVINESQRQVLLDDESLVAVRGISAYQNAIQQLYEQSLIVVTNYENAIADLFLQSQSAATTYVSTKIPSATGVTLPSDRPSIPIRYNEADQTLSFVGVMTSVEKSALQSTNPTLSEKIDQLFQLSWMAVKFFDPVFNAPLSKLPPGVDFQTQLDADLAAKITYDAEQELLCFTGIMSNTEQIKILALSTHTDYTTAINSLATQPYSTRLPSDLIWLTDADLDGTRPENDIYAKRLTTAISKARTYLAKTLTENSVVQQTSTQLGLTEAVTRYLLTQYAIVPTIPAKNLLIHLSSDFTLDATTLNAWFWVNRVVTIWKKWKLTLSELKRITTLIHTSVTGSDGNRAMLLDWGTLPLASDGAIASLNHFLRTSGLLRLRDSLPETQITLLEVLVKLNAGTTYTTAADFTNDVERLNEDWHATDVTALTTTLNLTYPTDYLLAESWERLRRAFYFLDSLNASVDLVKMFASPAISLGEAATLKELLRSKFGTETWLTLSAEIQDVLRERKRDALTAYLLSQPSPAKAPTRPKWENTNDLYAYYLLDVEMCSCQLTSRLVQASGSVQLFVQRCFMGLEPDVVVKADGADGDSAWRWWKWMRKYRVWEANRKVFLWPENWIEPELKKDRSAFFKDLENELLQNEINQDTVETAFINYLEKLDGVAQLEIAGFYQEDDGDNTILHVFGRTPGADPHLYYYRHYDYRQWSSWEKVDLDIQGDYLIPAVVNQRLYLFWPIFTEVPDEAGNSSVAVPTPGQTSFTPTRTRKKLRLQMAVSDFRQGKWTPKRISTDFDESGVYEVEIVRKHYEFFPIDRSHIDGRFIIQYTGHSIGRNNQTAASLFGSFDIFGCKGVPERITDSRQRSFTHVLQPKSDSVGEVTAFLKWVELGQPNEFGQTQPRQDGSENDFTLQNRVASIFGAELEVKVLNQTPDIFKISPPWHLSYFDQLWLSGLYGLSQLPEGKRWLQIPVLTGTWLPFFYNDRSRTFLVLPTVAQADGKPGYYYPGLKQFTRKAIGSIEQYITNWFETFNLSAVRGAERRRLEEFLSTQSNDLPPLRTDTVLVPTSGNTALLPQFLPSYTDAQIRRWLGRWLLRFYHYLIGAQSLQAFQTRKFHFKNFYHPFVCNFLRLVYHPLQGIPALMSRETQLLENPDFNFNQQYQPTGAVVQWGTEEFYPQDTVDFTSDGAYSPYNWELFFHAPLLIANSLSKNQRFEEARDWYHFIFNPIGVESTRPGGYAMSKYWITKPFYKTTAPQYVQQRIDNILRMLSGDTTVTDYSTQLKKDLEDQVLDWRTNPFEPHRIANYRTVAYQKTVVMKYLDNLIAWGDNLFRQDSMESINEATQLYILAAEILGPRPRKVPPQNKPPVESFNELETQFDAFSNALIEVENLVPAIAGSGDHSASIAPLPMLYFCIPQNEKLLGYWDTVADRLYKIRNCMNIEGIVRQLALFEPPIDPAALVKATAAGIDIISALADLNAPLPLYRFNVLLQKANEVCNDVKALGSALLSALEKKDAEAMGLLRQSQEIRLLEAVTTIREKQIEEARKNLESVRYSKQLAQLRKQYYESREFMNAGETTATVLNSLSITSHTAGTIADTLAGVMFLIPDFNIGASGFGGSPHFAARTGGDSAGNSATRGANGLYNVATILDKSAGLAATLAGYQRRQEEWDLQKSLAVKEIEQIDQSIAAAELRVAIAEKELENHLIQIENARATDEFMRSKYTNQELYQWQIGQISGVYFQSYRLAYDLAKRAERCFQFELGLQDSNYIQFGYWDSLKKGLLSGEKLQYHLRRLEAAYLEQNRREFELTKHISLALLDPLALIKLKETGRCFINLPEEIFDLDYPGHYFRRIKSVSLTLPCVVGPYTTISCTLRLLKNSVRINTQNGDNEYPRNTDDQGLPADDSRFVENNISVKAIATSSAQNDSGIFELSFRDERYLPFEGAGAISQWSLELFNDNTAEDFGKALRQFDYNTITDAILHIKYTAREDAGAFKNKAIAHLHDYFSQDGTTPSLRIFNLRQDFPNQWQRFLNPIAPATGNVFEWEISSNLFPMKDANKTLKINRIWLFARCLSPGNYTVTMTPPLPASSNQITLSQANQYGGLHFGQKEVEIEINLNASPTKWRLEMSRPNGNLKQEIEDVILVIGYEWVQ